MMRCCAGRSHLPQCPCQSIIDSIGPSISAQQSMLVGASMAVASFSRHQGIMLIIVTYGCLLVWSLSRLGRHRALAAISTLQGSKECCRSATSL
ncbi:hypothetical protein K461DRAFT_165103 [Myriangium duriaei CBS 260.36]|uniref:Uncharacterized protein n=1 Tax=Myriangium duriaei CBS 260.36 TaxID=1168546 RepID=A0A9P4IW31_9PEZI|nr:hypothetical protein K461DRAFT_165103 [Myriangium duriaei CBS 260.36]